MKKVMVFVILVMFAGCSKTSLNQDASVAYNGDPIEVGTIMTETAFLELVVVTGAVDQTQVSVSFPNQESQYTFLEDVDVVVVLSVDDDMIEKKVHVTVVDTEKPVIYGAYDREFGLNESIDVYQLITLKNPKDTVQIEPASIDASKLGTTTVVVSASDDNATVTASFDITISDFSKKSSFDHYGQTYGEGYALNVGALDVLVNKRHGLASDYVPANLITIEDRDGFQGRQGVMVVKEAYEAFVLMNQAMVDEAGYTPLSISTAYRSFGFQSILYTQYVESDGVEEADTYSARPGFSEHQTGLAIDIAADNKSLDDFGTTPQAIWVKENAVRFGFIIRFPEGKERITGYQYESWHIRYVGVDLAQSIVNSGLTFDEYFFAYNLGN